MNEEPKAITAIDTAISSADFKMKHAQLLEFVRDQLREAKDIKNGGSGDFGVIPYTKKKSLLKPGAEKLAKLFGLVPSYEKLKEIEDFEKGFVFYKYRCVLTHFATGKFAGDSVRSSNNKEKQFIVQNKTAYDLANNVEAKAQKRALVSAVVQATMASEIFDADISVNEETAPEKAVTKEEDPRRIRVTNQLYGAATAHGLSDNWIHVAIKKRWVVDSLSSLSNEQLEELTELIFENYEEVARGEKPKLKLVRPSQEVPEATAEEKIEEVNKEEAIDVDVIDEELQAAQKELEEKRKALGIEVQKAPVEVRRCEECKVPLTEDYPSLYLKCKECRMRDFIELGRKKKELEENQQPLIA